MDKIELGKLRQNYTRQDLRREMLLDDAMAQFKIWFSTAVDLEAELEPNAMVLATVGADLQPSARIVLLKEITKQGFVFYTNYLSQKGTQVAQNQKCALTFWWRFLQQQVRIEGEVSKVDFTKSNAYFKSRPVDSQRSAIISPQSQVLADRDYLENELQKSKNQISDDKLEKPLHWGGYEVVPHTIEFWQGRADRLHDRFRYTRRGNSWKIDRLAP